MMARRSVFPEGCVVMDRKSCQHNNYTVKLKNMARHSKDLWILMTVAAIAVSGLSDKLMLSLWSWCLVVNNNWTQQQTWREEHVNEVAQNDQGHPIYHRNRSICDNKLMLSSSAWRRLGNDLELAWSETRGPCKRGGTEPWDSPVHLRDYNLATTPSRRFLNINFEFTCEVGWGDGWLEC